MSSGAALANATGVTPEQMADCWEAFSINRNIKELNETSFKSYREQIIKDCDDSVLRKMTTPGAVVVRPSLRGSKNKPDALPTVTPPAKRLHQQRNSIDQHRANMQQQQLSASYSSDQDRRISLSPSRPVTAASNLTPSSSHTYAHRQGSGDVLFTYRPEMANQMTMTEPSGDRSNPRCQLQYEHFSTNVLKPYRHFFTSTEDRAQALDQQIVDLGSDICRRFGLEHANKDSVGDEDHASSVAGLEAVGVPRQVKVTNIGRICNAVSILELTF